MRKSQIMLAVASVSLLAAPAFAVGLGDLAKVVLNNGSILTKSQQKCGSSSGLSALDMLKISAARSAVQKALPAAEFLALDQAGNTQAETASQSTTFCSDTAVKKKGLLAKIATAAKGLAKARAGI